MAKLVRLVNENGNVSAKVRERLKNGCFDTIAKDMSEQYGMSSTISADKDLAIHIADDATNGNPIYAFVSITISQRDPEIKTAKSKTKSKSKSKVAKTEDELPDLFATEEEEGAEDDNSSEDEDEA